MGLNIENPKKDTPLISLGELCIEEDIEEEEDFGFDPKSGSKFLIN